MIIICTLSPGWICVLPQQTYAIHRLGIIYKCIASALGTPSTPLTQKLHHGLPDWSEMVTLPTERKHRACNALLIVHEQGSATNMPDPQGDSQDTPHEEALLSFH